MKGASSVSSHEELLDQLVEHALAAGKPSVVLMAGHLPLSYEVNRESGQLEARETPERWGAFSTYSMGVACDVIGALRAASSMETRVAVIVDDHTYTPMNVSSRKLSAVRNRFYVSRSGPDAVLPQSLHDMLADHGLDERIVLRADHGRPGRHDCLESSELLLRRSAPNDGMQCATAYQNWMEEVLGNMDAHIIGFVPHRCNANIIAHLLARGLIPGLSASNVFMATEGDLELEWNMPVSARGLWGQGVYIRHDSPRRGAL